MKRKFARNARVEEEFNQTLLDIEEDWSATLEQQLLDIRENIAQQMEKKNISRAALATMLGSSRAYVSQLLNGNENIRLSTLFKVAFALDLRPLIQFTSIDDEIVQKLNAEKLQETRLKPISGSATYTITAKIRQEYADTEVC
ncbi:MAG: helix-turn-helix transcriptional regulator [Bacteroidota bacterium]